MSMGGSIRLTLIGLFAASLVGGKATAQPDSFALRAKRVLPVSPDLPTEIHDGVVVVRDGRIVDVGNFGEVDVPPDLAVFDFPDGVVTPGFVAAASDLGGPHRGDESVAAGYRAVDTFDRFRDYSTWLAAGVTTVHIDSGRHRLLTGQGAVVRLGGPPADRVLRAAADLVVNLDPVVYDPPPDVTFPFPASADVAIQPPRAQRPASRVGQLLALDEAIQAARSGEPSDAFSFHRMELAKAWAAELPLRIRADRAADLLAAIRFLRRQDRPGYVVGGAEATLVAEALRAEDVPLVIASRTPLRSLGGDIGTNPHWLPDGPVDFQSLDGLQLAFAPDHVADLRLVAARALGAGLDRQRALAAITHTPAEILGVQGRVGSLAIGKDADLVVLTGDPLAVATHVQRVYVRGHEAYRPPVDGPLVIQAEMVWAGPDRWIPGGEILVEQGKIVAVGRRVPHPPFARVIDARPGGFVTPGFIDAHSHLGLDGDRSDVACDLRLSKLVGAADAPDTRVAAAGITTVLVSPYKISANGATCAAIKTHGSRRAQRVIQDPAAVLFDLRSADPLEIPEILGKPIAAGQKYLDAWNKYDKDLKAFLEKKAGDQKTGDKSTGDKQSETETDPSGSDKTGEDSPPAGPDPITGTWAATITDVPLPDPVSATIVLQLTDSTVEGRITRTSVGVTARVSGFFDGKHLSAEVTPDREIPGLQPPMMLDVDLVGEDHAQGTITAMGIPAKIDAKRTDKNLVEWKVARSRTQGKDGRPLPPKVNPAWEPLKALLKKEIPAVVRVSTAAQIKEVLALLVDKHELPVTLLGAEEASAHAEKLVAKEVAVVVPPDVLRKRQYRDYHQADDLSRRGVSIAFQSDAEDAARHLPAVILYAVERGLDAQTALEAFTAGAARAMKIDDRVGTIEPGKDADLVIFNADPFEAAGRVLRVIVDGQEVTP